VAGPAAWMVMYSSLSSSSPQTAGVVLAKEIEIFHVEYHQEKSTGIMSCLQVCVTHIIIK